MAPAPDQEPLTAIDAAWLRMDDPTNLMTITGVMTFEEPLEWAHLKNIIEDRFLAYRRFRMKVVEPWVPLAKPRWKDDETFALGPHLKTTELPEPGDQNQLQELVSDLMSRPLDPSRPLWQMHYVTNYRGGSALIVRVHHCIGDGLSLLPVLLHMTDTTPGGEETDTAGDDALPRRQQRARSSVASIVREVVREGMNLLADPGKAIEMAKAGGDAAATLGRLVAMGPDPDSVFRGRLGVEKKAAWSEAIPLDEVKRIGKVLGGTVNDVLMAAVAGALRTYLLGRDGVEPGTDLRAVLPVNLRRPDDLTLGNKFGLVFLALPVGVEDPVERLQVVQRRMNALKSSSEPAVSFAVLQAVGTTTAEVEEMVINIFGTKATAVATNVPGPRQPLFFCTKKVRSIMFWVPQSGRLGMGISVLSYAGGVRIGLATDVGLVPDPETIVGGYQEAIAELSRAADAVAGD